MSPAPPVHIGLVGISKSFRSSLVFASSHWATLVNTPSPRWSLFSGGDSHDQSKALLLLILFTGVRSRRDPES